MVIAFHLPCTELLLMIPVGQAMPVHRVPLCRSGVSRSHLPDTCLLGLVARIQALRRLKQEDGRQVESACGA